LQGGFSAPAICPRAQRHLGPHALSGLICSKEVMFAGGILVQDTKDINSIQAIKVMALLDV